MHSFPEVTSAQDRAYHHVKAQILSLSLKPGQWVKAQDIATKVSVSRTPVREALCRLEQEGFVRRDQGWGYVVESITVQEAHDLYKVREVLEVEAAREAAVRATAAHLRALEAFLGKAEAAHTKTRIAAFRVHTRAFHSAVAGMSGNALLVRMLSQLEDRIRLLGAMVLEGHHQRMGEVMDENRAILEALRAGDVARAEAAARRHVERAREVFLMYVAKDTGWQAQRRL